MLSELGYTRKLYVHIPVGEVRGGLEERDQEIAKVERPNKNMACKWRNQGQIHSDGEQETHRNGVLKIKLEF